MRPKLARQKHQNKDDGKSKSRPLEPFLVVPHDFGFDPKIDLDKMNSLADELAASDAIHPEIEKITGLVPPDGDAKESYLDHLSRKHRCSSPY